MEMYFTFFFLKAMSAAQGKIIPEKMPRQN